MTNHHPTEATLVSYAAGSLGDALSLVVSSHLSLCPKCRERARIAQEAGGAILEAIAPVPVTSDALAHMMARLEREDEQARRSPSPAHASPEVRDLRLPKPLARRMGVSHLDEIRWRWLAPGVRTHVVETPETGGTLRMLRIAPGTAMPEHGHGGTELTLVLSGSYADETGHYGAGDIADLDEDAEHSPKVDSDEDCICLIATEAPTRFKGVFGRIVQRYVGF